MFKRLLDLYDQYQSVIAYLFFGGLTTLINLVVFFLTVTLGGWNYQIGNILAWFLSVLFAYLTNRVWVFGSHYSTMGALIREAVSFFLVRGGTLLIDILIMFVGVGVMKQNELLVKLVDQIVVILANYFFSKWFVFRTNH